jgi:folate-dependent phosphoribosylglycinamide formyltransferase PurN
MRKVILITNSDFAGTLFFNRLLKHDIGIEAVYLVSALRGNFLGRLRRALTLCATRSMIFLWYKTAVERLLFKWLSVDERTIKSIRRLCRERGIPCEEVRDVDETAFVGKIRRSGKAMVLSAYGSQKFSDALIAAAGVFWNVHGSYLPYYRGAASYFWMLMNDAQPRGVTIHEVAGQLDAGTIITQRVINPNFNESLYSYHARCVLEAADLFMRAYGKYWDAQAGKTVFGGYRPTETMEIAGLPLGRDVREFKKKGKHFFYWNDFRQIKGHLN